MLHVCLMLQFFLCGWNSSCSKLVLKVPCIIFWFTFKGTIPFIFFFLLNVISQISPPSLKLWIVLYCIEFRFGIILVTSIVLSVNLLLVRLNCRWSDLGMFLATNCSMSNGYAWKQWLGLSKRRSYHIRDTMKNKEIHSMV